jgi:hypothetical protein
MRTTTSSRLSRQAVRLITRVALSLITASSAFAQPPEATIAAAKAHFQSGYEAAQHGQLQLAIKEFELAYALRPHYSVLYNLGQAYASAGRSVEAVDTLARYLELGGTQISQERAQQVRDLIEFHEGLLGEIELDVSPAGAEIWLDGTLIGKAPIAGRVRASGGSHGVAVALPGFVPAHASVNVTARAAETVRITLVPLEAAAELQVRCSLPDVVVQIDDRVAGKTPLASGLRQAVGEHRVRFSRPGYRPVEHRVQFEAGKRTYVDCALTHDPTSKDFGKLSVLHPEGTRLTLDGAAFRGQPVPPGRHVLMLSGAGYEPVTRELSLSPRQTLTLTLNPNRRAADYREQRANRARKQRLVSYVIGSVGLAAAGSATVLYVTNTQRYAEWREDSRQFVAEYARDPTATTPLGFGSLLERENSIRNQDAIALGLGVLSVTLLAAATGLYLTADVPEPRFTLTAERAELTLRRNF